MPVRVAPPRHPFYPMAEAGDILVTDIAGNFGPEFMDGLLRELRFTEDKEKAGYWVRQSRLAKREHDAGRQVLKDMGQKVSVVDSVTWFRWVNEIGWDAMHDPKEHYGLLRDNPEWKAPGYWRPKTYKATETIKAG